MSINHFSPDLQETLWRAQQQHQHHHHNMEPPSKPNSLAAAPTAFWANSQLYHPIEANNPLNSALNFDLNNENEDETTIEDERENNDRIIKQVEEKEIPKEPLFEKPLTPSDVGKLNRLVIPKQHAEKYFPLGGNDSGGEKGLLLSFEDESGKPWRFRYSYWNSSQSYVLTKGWSRFVKEKRLDAGDIVLFERHRLDGDRLFIGWRRRRSSAAAQEKEGGGVGQGQPATVGGGWTRVYFPAGHHAYPPPQQQQHHHHHHGPALPYQPECLHAAAAASQNQTTATSANSKRLRLFGVNLECQQQPSESESSSETPNPPDGSSIWSHGQGQGQGQGQAHYQFQYDPKVHHAYFNHQNHRDINFSRDVNQMR